MMTMSTIQLNTSVRLAALLVTASLVSSCTTFSREYKISSSNLAAGEDYEISESDEAGDNQSSIAAQPKGFQSLNSLSASNTRILRSDEAKSFSRTNSLSFSADNMPADEFVHTVFGELLKLNYVLAEEVKSTAKPVTLNLQKPVSSQELYLLATQILASSGVGVKLQDNVFFVFPAGQMGADSKTIGIGRLPSNVPQVVGPILQIIPIRYGMNVSLERTLRELVTAQITPDFEKNVLFVTGERTEILRALDLVELMDMPSSRSQHVGILRLTYISTEDFTKKITHLLQAEGIPLDSSQTPKSNLALVPLEQIGAVALFGSDQFYLDRVNFWAQQLDQPSEGAEKRYYIFHPRFARAADLGSSIAALLGADSKEENREGNQSRDTASAFSTSGGGTSAQTGSSVQRMSDSLKKDKPGASSVRTENVTMTVDERSNTIIFYTSGIEYQNLLPMIKRLDVMPKQILLEATIAEVSLTDDFKMGVEYAIRNGKFGSSTSGAFGAEDFGGLGLSYIDGADNIIAQFRESNNKVNVLSNPTLVVRDGVSANINVGTDIPVIGTTTINPGTDTSSTTVEYRKTGVQLTVTPTINGQGLVVLEIQQSISNTVSGSTNGGSPSIFERSLQTEVLAQSGQTILLGGLISEDSTKNKTKVPFLGDLPLFGGLFRAETDETKKTELVILITPKVMDQPEQWQNIRQKLNSGFENLKLKE
jgi:general secretion pathway protein D